MQQRQFRDLFNLVVIPSVLFALAFSIFYGAQVDFVVAAAIFDLEGGQWRLTNHWLFSDVLHNGSRLCNSIILINLLGFWLYQQLSRQASSERSIALTKLLLSLLLSLSSVALLKRALPAECHGICSNLAALCHLLAFSLTDPALCIQHNVFQPDTPVLAMPGSLCTSTFCRSVPEKRKRASLSLYCLVHYLGLPNSCAARTFSHTT